MHRLVAAATLLLASACGGGGTPIEPPQAPVPTAPGPTDPAVRSPEAPRPPGDPARGEALFAELGCKGCHGGKGEGGGIGPDLFAKAWDDTGRTAARATILRGFPERDPPMPAYRGQLDETQLDHLLAFVAPR